MEMPDATVVKRIRLKFRAVEAELDERGRRRWAAAEARSLGWGGVTTVSAATRISDRTIRFGVAELACGKPPFRDRQRRPAGGRRAKEVVRPELLKAVQRMVEATTRGDPTTPIRWTCKSTRTISAELKRLGFEVSHTKTGWLLHQLGYSLQANRKTIEGKQHPDRDAQFSHIARRGSAYLRTGQPAISVDTKKKEPLGNMRNPRRSYRKMGKPARVTTHDLPDAKLGKAVPYGVYELANNEAGVTVGISHDTAEFATAAIRRWWTKMGRKRYPRAKRLFITADCGGSNSPQRNMAMGTARASERHGRENRSMPFSAGHEQMEQDRAPSFLPHHAQLAGDTSGDTRHRREADRRHQNQGRVGSARMAR